MQGVAVRAGVDEQRESKSISRFVLELANLYFWKSSAMVDRIVFSFVFSDLV